MCRLTVIRSLTSRFGYCEKIVLAKIIINAAGPWAEHFLSKVIEGAPTPRMRLVQGSHIVVPKLFDHESAYIFQNTDNRIVFAIPYERGFTMVRTITSRGCLFIQYMMPPKLWTQHM